MSFQIFFFNLRFLLQLLEEQQEKQRNGGTVPSMLDGTVPPNYIGLQQMMLQTFKQLMDNRKMPSTVVEKNKKKLKKIHKPRSWCFTIAPSIAKHH